MAFTLIMVREGAAVLSVPAVRTLSGFVGGSILAPAL
jgi:hypothetical protein